MTEWKEYTVQDLIDLDMIEEPMDGNHGGIHPKTSDYVPIGVPFIMANNLVNGTVDLENCAFISNEQAKGLRKGFSHPGDVLLTHKATMGRTAIVPDKYQLIVLTPQVTYYRVKKGINRKYLKYYFDSPDFQNILTNWANSGSTRAYLGITAQHKLPIIMPSEQIQNKIADILGALDGKIMSNIKINRNLLEQAIAVFEEKIWSKDKNGTIGDYCIMKSGFAFKSSWWTDEGVKVIKIGDINQDNLILATCSHVNEDKVKKARDFSVKAGDLVLAMTGATIGKFAMVTERSETILVNQRVGKFFLGEEPLKKVPFIYCTLKMDDVYSEVIGRGQGSAQPNISGNDVMTIPCVIPTDIEIDKFNEFAEPIFASIVKNQNENEKLANLRDGLLPKLMSGELDVKDLNI